MQNSLQQPQIIQIVLKGHLNRPKGAISPDRRSDFIRDMRISLDHRSNFIKGALLFCNAPLVLLRPFPLGDFRHIYAVFGDILPMLHQLILHALDKIRPAIAELGEVIYSRLHQIEAV